MKNTSVGKSQTVNTDKGGFKSIHSETVQGVSNNWTTADSRSPSATATALTGKRSAKPRPSGCRRASPSGGSHSMWPTRRRNWNGSSRLGTARTGTCPFRSTPNGGWLGRSGMLPAPWRATGGCWGGCIPLLGLSPSTGYGPSPWRICW